MDKLWITLILCCPLLVWADPAIDARDGSCSIPVDAFDQDNQYDTNPGNDDGTKVVRFNGEANGRCKEDEERVPPPFLTSIPGILPAVPFDLVLTGRDTGFLCRMIDKDGGVWYARRWRARFAVAANPDGSYSVRKRLVCRRGVQRP